MISVGDTPIVQLPVRRWRDGHWESAWDSVAEETPVSLSFNSIPHVVMLATPRDLADLGVGFTVSEALVARVDEVRDVVVSTTAEGHEVRVSVTQERLS
ncbi:MAG: formate dehydrogenase accessory sulfurtransferase FdhD, partial [Pseudomonadota bacterium]